VCRILDGQLGVPTGVLDGHRGIEEVTEAALQAVEAMGVLPQGMLAQGETRPTADTQPPKDPPLPCGRMSRWTAKRAFRS